MSVFGHDACVCLARCPSRCSSARADCLVAGSGPAENTNANQRWKSMNRS